MSAISAPFAPPPKFVPKVDPFALEGFTRIDHINKPKVKGLSNDVWRGIFPPLREQVLRKAAAYYYRHREEINCAVRRADDEVDAEIWLFGTHLEARAFQALMPFFPDCGLRNGAPSPEVVRFAKAVAPAAKRWKDILSSDNAYAAAWFSAGIAPIAGACIISGQPLSSWSVDDHDSFVRPEFASNFSEAGSVLCALIVAEAERNADEAKRLECDSKPELDPFVNPDDPSTYNDLYEHEKAGAALH